MNALIVKIRKLYKLLPPLLSRELKERYAGSAIGLLWTFVQPLLFILVFWLVFSQITRVRVSTDTGEIPFLAYLLSGLLPWFALQEGVMKGASSIVDRGYMIKKVFYPAELFPISSALSSLIHHGTGFFVFLLGFFIYKGGVSLSQVSLVGVLLFLQIMITVGFSLLLSSLTVYLRDIMQILGVAFQAVFYMTTILYPMASVPEGLRTVVSLNPFTPLIEGYHSVILYNRPPETWVMLYLFLFAAASVSSGIFIFRKLKRGFVDVL